MAVTVNVYNALTQLILSKGIDLTNLRLELLNNTATFVGTHTSKNQVDNGSTATVTISNATPGVITDTAHGFSVGQAVAFTTTGTLPTGLSPSVFYYVLAAGLTANAYSVSATPGGSAIATSSAGTGTHSRYSSGAYETYGNGWIPGGPTLAAVAINAASVDSDGTSNDAILTATNPSVTATGGSLPPAAAYNALLYDATSMKPLMYVSFGQAQQAGITTNFVFLINALGLLNLLAP
jgi:hypothetical protein